MDCFVDDVANFWSRLREVQPGADLRLRVDALRGQQRGLRRGVRAAVGGMRPGAGHLHEGDPHLDELHRDHRDLLHVGVPLGHERTQVGPHHQLDSGLREQRGGVVHPLVLGVHHLEILQRNFVSTDVKKGLKVL